MLEFLYLDPPIDNGSTHFVLPETFRAPHLRHLVLSYFAFPRVFSSLPPAKGLTTLTLEETPASAYFSPNSLLQWVSLMPQLLTLQIGFRHAVPNPGQDFDMPMMTHVTLPNLRWFTFTGASAYLEALLPQVMTPLLEKLDVNILDQLAIPISLANLKQFISNASNFRFTLASLFFDEDGVDLNGDPLEGTIRSALSVTVDCRAHYRQAIWATQMCGVLGPKSSTVVDLDLSFRGSVLPLYNRATRIQWREVLKSFNNVKTLRLAKAFLWNLSLSLQVHDGESSMEVLPELKEIRCDASDDDVSDTFDAFLEARENAGFPVIFFCNA
jgi:hypothetical protein